MKIWIVEYSATEDHINLAVCTSLEKAQEFLGRCDKENKYEHYSIYEYETDVWCWYPNYGKPDDRLIEPIESASK